MPSFRAYWLDAKDRVISGEDIEASELSEAVAVARRMSKKYPNAHPDRLEVWTGVNRVFRRLDTAVSLPSRFSG
jgi:hypothetical protein